MRVHFLQHVAFETPGYINDWAEWNDFDTSFTRLFENEVLPALDDFDLLVVMGGPMGVYNNDQYPWLIDEKTLIKKSIEAGKYVLGVCLGAQLIAASMGAKVYPSGLQEIGWYKIRLSETGEKMWKSLAPDYSWTVLHWHGDTFDLPEGATLLASSEAISNQAFCIGDNVLAFQFHLEATPVNATAMITKLEEDLKALQGEKWVMSAKEIMEPELFFNDANALLEAILDKFVGNE